MAFLCLLLITLSILHERFVRKTTETMSLPQKRGIELQSFKENIDTTTAASKFLFSMMATLAEFDTAGSTF